MDTALKKGIPIIANIDGKKFYSPGFHYVAILGYDASKNLIISNPCKPGQYGSEGNKPVTLDTFFNTYLGGGSSQFIIPDYSPVEEPLVINKISYNPEKGKGKKTTVTIETNKKIKSANGEQSGNWTINNSNGKYIAEHTYTENQKIDNVTIIATDGTTSAAGISINNIDKTVNLAKTPVDYSSKVVTNKDITVTISALENLKKVTNHTASSCVIDGRLAKLTYSSNKKETVRVWDLYDNYKDVEINVSKIDKTAPKIVNTQNSIVGNITWVLVTADEPIKIAKLNNSDGAIAEVTEDDIKEMRKRNSEITVPNDLRCCVIYMYYNNNKDTISIKDYAGNVTNSSIDIENIETLTADVKYYVGEKCVSKNNRMTGKTNKDVKVIITTNYEIESIKYSLGEPTTNLMEAEKHYYTKDKKYAYNTYKTTDFPNGVKDTLTITDTKGRSVVVKLNVKIDTSGPEISSSTANSRTDGGINLDIVFDEDCSIINAQDWMQGHSRNNYYKNYSNEVIEYIAVKDDVGNISRFKIIIYKENEELKALVNKDETVEIEEVNSEYDKNKNSVKLTITFDRGLMILSEMDKWNRVNNNTYNREYTEPIVQHVVGVDSYGRDFNFKVIVTEKNGELEVTAERDDAAILKELSYENYENYAVNVSMKFDKKVELNDKTWSCMQNGNEWIYEKTYYYNTPESGDIIEIENIAPSSKTLEFFDNDNIKIVIQDIDNTPPDLPVIDEGSYNNDTDPVEIIVSFDEPLLFAQIIPNEDNDTEVEIVDVQKKDVKCYVKKGTTLDFCVEDLAWNDLGISVSIDKNGDLYNSVVHTVPLEVYMNYDKSDSSNSVTVTTHVAGKIDTIDGEKVKYNTVMNNGWKVTEGVNEQKGKYILTKTYDYNVVDEVDIKDEEGNSIIGKDVQDGKLRIDTNSTKRIALVNPPKKTVYNQGDILNLEGLKLEVTYEDGKKEIIEYNELTDEQKKKVEVSKEFEYGEYRWRNVMMLSIAGPQQLIRVRYDGIESEDAAFYIMVDEYNSQENNNTKLSVNSYTNKSTYKKGEAFESSGFSFNVKNNDEDEAVEVTEGIEFDEITFDETGIHTIYASYNGSSIPFNVNVVEEISEQKIVNEIEIKEWPNLNKQYIEGDRIDTKGLVLNVTYLDGTSDEITKGFSVTPEIFESGYRSIEISYGGKNIETHIDVEEKQVTDLEIVKNPSKMTYKIGESADLTGIEIKATFNNNTNRSEIITNLDNLDYETESLTELGNKIINIKLKGYEEKTVPLTVTVKEKAVITAEILQYPNNLSYKVGDQLDLTGFVIRVNYDDGTFIDYKGEEFAIIPPVFETEGSQTISYTVGNKQLAFVANVSNNNTTKTDDDKKIDDNTNLDNKDNKNEEDNGSNSNNAVNEHITDSKQIVGDNDNLDGNKENNNDEIAIENSDGTEGTQASKEIQEDGNTQNNTNKDPTTAPTGYKDANTANSKLPQTGMKQIIVIMLVICAVVSGGLFIKYRKI